MWGTSFKLTFFFSPYTKTKKNLQSINFCSLLSFIFIIFVFFYFYTTQNSLCPAILSSFNILGNSLSRNCPIFCIFYSFIFIFLFILIRYVFAILCDKFPRCLIQKWNLTKFLIFFLSLFLDREIKIILLSSTKNISSILFFDSSSKKYKLKNYARFQRLRVSASIFVNKLKREKSRRETSLDNYTKAEGKILLWRVEKSISIYLLSRSRHFRLDKAQTPPLRRWRSFSLLTFSVF